MKTEVNDQNEVLPVFLVSGRLTEDLMKMCSCGGCFQEGRS